MRLLGDRQSAMIETDCAPEIKQKLEALGAFRLLGAMTGGIQPELVLAGSDNPNVPIPAEPQFSLPVHRLSFEAGRDRRKVIHLFKPWLAERLTLAFQLFGGIGVAYSLVLVLLLRDNPRPVLAGGITAAPIKVVEPLRSLFGSRKFNLAVAFWTLLGVTTWGFTGWLPTFLIEQFQLPQGRAGLMVTGFMSLGTITGMIVAGAWADRWSRNYPAGRSLVGIIGLAICIPCVFIVANSAVLPLTLGALVLFGLTRAFPDANMMPILFDITDDRYRATGFGILNAFSTIAGGTVIYIGGALRDAQVNVTAIFYGGAVGMVVCMGLLWLIRPRNPGFTH